MRGCWRIFALVVAVVLLVPLSAYAKATPTPRPPAKKSAAEKPKREDLPSCAEMRISVRDMRAALERHAEEAGEEGVSGRRAFDAIGDELGCRWPEPGEEGAGLMELLERGGGHKGEMK